MDAVALSMFGLTEEDMEETNTVYIFPDNWQSFLTFEFLGTQWRTASGGVVGLDYNVMPLAFEMFDISKEDQKEVMHDIRLMEARAITLLNSDNNKKRD